VEEELLDAICRALSLPGPAAEATAPQAANVDAPGRGLRILLAEDNPYNQAVMEGLLPRRGHTVQAAGDGRAALAALESGNFDLLLLDIHMPEVDGFQVVAELRRRERGTGKRLPIIALTARSAEGERERCLRAGMDDYLVKPARAAELFATIDRVVAGGDARPPAGPGHAGLNGLIDRAALLAACDGDEGLLRKMCQHFRAFVPGRLAEVSEALRERDAGRLREAVHKLGGMVSTFSAAAAEAVVLLGRLGSEGKFEEAAQANARLVEAVAGVLSVLEGLSAKQLQ
jgi:CheY-like chemotaxis protein